jgi:hypothetical protein
MYTALWAPAMYGLLGTSKHLQIGPTSLISLYLPIAMAMAGVTPEHFPDDQELDAYWRAKRVSLAPVLTFWVGIIFLVLSITKAGNLIKFVSHSVMTGFVSAAGLFIGLSQLPQILGYPIHGEFPKNYMLFEALAEYSISDGNKYVQSVGDRYMALLGIYQNLTTLSCHHQQDHAAHGRAGVLVLVRREVFEARLPTYGCAHEEPVLQRCVDSTELDPISFESFGIPTDQHP